MVLLRADPEVDDINSMLTEAITSRKSQDAHANMRNDRDRQMEGENQKPKQEWTRFKNCTGGNKNFKPAETEERMVQNKSDKVQANAVVKLGDCLCKLLAQIHPFLSTTPPVITIGHQPEN